MHHGPERLVPETGHHEYDSQKGFFSASFIAPYVYTNISLSYSFLFYRSLFTSLIVNHLFVPPFYKISGV